MSAAGARVRRRRLVALAVLVAVAAVAALAIARALREEERPDTLARLVPAGALVYVHASTEPGREAGAQLATRLERLPTLRRLRASALRRVGGRSPGFSFERDIRPWLGNEAAFALLPGARPDRADSLILARVRERDLTRVFLARAGARRATSYRDVVVQRLGDVSLALAGDALLIGQDQQVRAAIDLAQGRGLALPRSAAFRQARAGEPPEDRVVRLYASARGARSVLAPLAGGLRALLRSPSLVGLGADVSPDPAGVRIVARAAHGRTRPARAGFSPELVRAAPRDATGVLALTSLDPLARRLFAAAPALERLSEEAGVDLERDLLAPLRGGEVVAWTSPGGLVPAVALAARTRDPARTREALGRLQGPLAAALVPGEEEAGQVPLFEQRTVAGVPAFALSLAPGVELVYAVFDRRVVIATSEQAIARVRRGERGALDAAKAAGRVAAPPEGVEAVTLLDPRQLLALGDQIGVTADPALQAVRDDLRNLRTVSAVAQRSGTDSTAEILLELP